jgi:hypothetical protein
LGVYNHSLPPPSLPTKSNHSTTFLPLSHIAQPPFSFFSIAQFDYWTLILHNWVIFIPN